MERVRVAALIDWPLLCRTHPMPVEAYAWVSDASIQHAIDTGNIGNPQVPHTAATHRAARVAGIVVRMRCGDVFPPVLVDIRTHEVAVPDGHHRLRAHWFLHHRVVPAYVTGEIQRIENCLRPHVSPVILLRRGIVQPGRTEVS